MSWTYINTGIEPPVANAVEPAAASLESDAIGGVGIATVIDAGGSGGVGVCEEQVNADAVAFADACRRAVQNCQPLNEIPAFSGSLSQIDQQRIYEAACAQQGTSPEEVAAKAEERRQQDMQAIQQGVFGLAGLGLAANANANEFSLASGGVTGGDTISLAALGNLSPLQTPNLAQERGIGFSLA